MFRAVHSRLSPFSSVIYVCQLPRNPHRGVQFCSIMITVLFGNHCLVIMDKNSAMIPAQGRHSISIHTFNDLCLLLKKLRGLFINFDTPLAFPYFFINLVTNLIPVYKIYPCCLPCHRWVLSLWKPPN